MIHPRCRAVERSRKILCEYGRNIPEIDYVTLYERERQRNIENRSLENDFEASGKRNVIGELFRREDCKMVLAPRAENVYMIVVIFNPPPLLSNID